MLRLLQRHGVRVLDEGPGKWWKHRNGQFKLPTRRRNSNSSRASIFKASTPELRFEVSISSAPDSMAASLDLYRPFSLMLGSQRLIALRSRRLLLSRSASAPQLGPTCNPCRAGQEQEQLHSLHFFNPAETGAALGVGADF